MPYFMLEDFKSGLDNRRREFSAPAGTLSTLRNAHITAGGEIEKRHGFENTLNAPADTLGLASVRNTLFILRPGTFGAVSPSPPGPAGDQVEYVEYEVEPFNGSATITEIVDWDVYDGKLYIVSKQNDGSDKYVHQYNGVRVTLPVSMPDTIPHYIRTHQTKMYAVAGDTLWFSAVNDPSDWSGTGSGFIKLSNEDAEAAYSVGLEIYYDRLAIMSRYATQLWSMDPDPNLNSREQVLRNSGTIAPLSLRQYGSGDVLFLADSGIRSMRAKDSSNSASVTDIGSPVDPIIRDIVRSMGAEYLSGTRAHIHPLTGRFWMVLPDRILVLSYFPGPKVTAWSEYTMEFTQIDSAVAGSQIALLADDKKVYLYAGASTDFFDSAEVTVKTPFMHMEHPAHRKDFQGLDAAIWSESGSWQVRAYFSPTKAGQSAFNVIANLDDITYGKGRIAMGGQSTHLSLEMVHTGAGEALLGNIAVHYKTGEAD